ncbi:MAG: peptide chain release factor N(5)-glutamine methyltransferase [Elusimicrobia bacterium]|nr:peptide chain release factor N(5)-glutamine methyltransferase [Elusimicrobiota bacterium]
MNGIELLNWGKMILGSNYVCDAEVLLSHILGLKTGDIYLGKRNVNIIKRKKYEKCVVRRKSGIPTAYITGNTEFMGLKFFINRYVLIPRQETEILVEEIIKLSNHLIIGSSNRLSILDIGTGSGNIAVSLARYIDNSKITAVDISDNALKVAEKNAKFNSVSEKISFLRTDLFAKIPAPISSGRPLRQSLSEARGSPNKTGRRNLFDIIVSNPPYIRTSEIPKLQKEIQYEPVVSLDGGKDGFSFYEKIVLESKKYLKNNGFLAFEIGYHHSKKVRDMMIMGGFKNINVRKDYSGNERVIYGQKNNTNIPARPVLSGGRE